MGDIWRNAIEAESISYIKDGGTVSDLQSAIVAQERLARGPGKNIYVNTVGGSDANAGLSWEEPFATMATAFALAADNDVIRFIGTIKEQLLAPLGVQGVAIIGAAGGRTRHDDGARWTSPDSPAATTPLLTLREQGWELHNILFVPPSDAPAVRFRRAEDATYPDGSHAIVRGCKYVSDGDTGIEDHGGCHHWLIEDCEFAGSDTVLTNGIKHVTGAGIAAPFRDTIRRCTFTSVTNSIQLPGTECVVRDNLLGAGTIIVDTSGGSGGNFVVDNVFPDATLDIDNAHGYTGHASDAHWRNLSTDQAAANVGVPGA